VLLKRQREVSIAAAAAVLATLLLVATHCLGLRTFPTPLWGQSFQFFLPLLWSWAPSLVLCLAALRQRPVAPSAVISVTAVAIMAFWIFIAVNTFRINNGCDGFSYVVFLWPALLLLISLAVILIAMALSARCAKSKVAADAAGQDDSQRASD
jgi:uncharacterized membrane protein